MSDPRSKSLRSKAKDIRQGLPQREVIRGKKKVVAKPFHVERRYPDWLNNDWCPYREWHKEKSFATRELADAYIEKELRSIHCIRFKPEHRPEFRITAIDNENPLCSSR